MSAITVVDNIVTATGVDGRTRTVEYHDPELARAAAEAMGLRASFGEELTFAQFVGLWRRYHAGVRLKLVSLASYESIIANHLMPYFGDIELRRINEKLLERFIQDQLNRHGYARAVTPSIIKLQAILGIAVKWGYLKENPARRIDAMFLSVRQ